MNTYNTNVDIFDQELLLPEGVFLPFNRCNIPAAVLGSRQFQQHPKSLSIDGISMLYKTFFAYLDECDSAQERAQLFMDTMAVHFRLSHLEDAGWDKQNAHHRDKADYLRMLRGWLFDTNSREGAVLKAWVESRFGLVARYHGGHLTDRAHYQAYRQARSQGIYGTNALEAQLDLLYSYCQYELARRYEEKQTLCLYRGIHHIQSYEVLRQKDDKHATVLLNNLNSFSSDKERADEFGDQILSCQVPWQKILFFSNLLPGVLSGENEYLVLGGVYDIAVTQVQP
jgi:NAD+--dinitrogen-reductase ADP-D-ribosyltransferase